MTDNKTTAKLYKITVMKTQKIISVPKDATGYWRRTTTVGPDGAPIRIVFERVSD